MNVTKNPRNADGDEDKIREWERRKEERRYFHVPNCMGGMMGGRGRGLGGVTLFCTNDFTGRYSSVFTPLSLIPVQYK